MSRRSIRKRVEDMAKRHQQHNMPLAVVSTVGMTPEDAAAAIELRRGELSQTNYQGMLVILDH